MKRLVVETTDGFQPISMKVTLIYVSRQTWVIVEQSNTKIPDVQSMNILGGHFILKP